MNISTRTLAIALASLAFTVGPGPASAQARHGGHWVGHSWHGHGYWAPGPLWGGVGIGIGLGYYYAPWYPGYVVVQSPSAVYYEAPTEPREPVANVPLDPIFFPRNGQSSAQTETDRRDCNRWATTQPNAMADASVFHRTTLACMEGRGYSVR